MKIFIRDPWNDQTLAKLQKLGVSLSPPQQDFIRQHSHHRGLVVENDIVACRTCNERSRAVKSEACSNR